MGDPCLARRFFKGVPGGVRYAAGRLPGHWQRRDGPAFPGGAFGQGHTKKQNRYPYFILAPDKGGILSPSKTQNWEKNMFLFCFCQISPARYTLTKQFVLDFYMVASVAPFLLFFSFTACRIVFLCVRFDRVVCAVERIQRLHSPLKTHD